MFDHDALKLLQQTAIGDYCGKQERLQGTDTIALPDNFKIHDLEKFKDNRRRFRGALSTHSLADFVSYSLKHGDAHTSRVFIDDDNFSATTIVDLGTLGAPEHAEHTATLKLKQTAAFCSPRASLPRRCASTTPRRRRPPNSRGSSPTSTPSRRARNPTGSRGAGRG